MLEQAKDLSIPGLILIISSKILFDVIEKIMKKNKEKETSDSNNSMHELRIDAVLANLTENMIRQTTILERMAQDHSDLAKNVNRMESKIDRATTRMREMHGST